MTTDADQIPQDSAAVAEAPKADANTEVLPNTDSPDKVVEERFARIEASQQMTAAQIQQITAAVGRVQSLAAKFDKTGDPKVEDKVRAEMAGVYSLLGEITDNIDDAILPKSAKVKVESAREAARRVADQLEIEQRVQDAIAKNAPAPAETPQIDANAIEARVLAEMARVGADPDKLDWDTAASLLHGAGEPAMWKFINGQVATQLKEIEKPRPRVQSPPAAGPAKELDPLDPSKTIAERTAWLRANGIL